MSLSVLGRIHGCPMLNTRKRVAVTLCPGESTGLSFAVYMEKVGSHPLSWGEYRAVICCIRGKGWLSPYVLGRVQGCLLLYTRKRVAVTLCPGESTGLSFAVYAERGGCHPMPWGEYKAVL